MASDGGPRGRACERCGAGLRRGRSGTRCDPCSRRPDVAERLREARFFSRDAVQRALAAYDFGYLFRSVRRTAGLTQVELGEVLEMGQDRISRIERGEHRLRDIETIARIATRLGISPTLLGFGADSPPHQDPQPVPACPERHSASRAPQRDGPDQGSADQHEQSDLTIGPISRTAEPDPARVAATSPKPAIATRLFGVAIFFDDDAPWVELQRPGRPERSADSSTLAG